MARPFSLSRTSSRVLRALQCDVVVPRLGASRFGNEVADLFEVHLALAVRDATEVGAPSIYIDAGSRRARPEPG